MRPTFSETDMNKHLIALVSLVAAGCASAPSSSTPAAPTGISLTYNAPAPVTGTYEFADSSAFTIQGGAIGDIRAATKSIGTANATYAAKGTDVELRVAITDLTGSFSNSAMGGTVAVTEADVTGEAILTITPNGAVVVNQTPTTTRAAQQMGMSAAFFRRFVVRLPAGRVQPGAVWTDTVTNAEDAAGMKSSVHDVVTATYARDTTVAGRTLNVITHATQRRLEVAGSSEGVQIVQKLSGTATGYTLWDAQRNVVVERSESTSLSGTFDLPAMGLTGLPVTATGLGRITLR
jgi:hypothetical protein